MQCSDNSRTRVDHLKALSLRQPYANLIVQGKKTIELRSWATKFRGEFYIHASKQIMVEDCIKFGYNPKIVTTGAIIGKAYLYDVKLYKTHDEWLADADKHLAGEDFRMSMNGFLLKDAEEFSQAIPVKGKLNFFEVVVNLGWWD